MVNDDRGQLLLVAGVLLALVIVASAVLLNGIVAPGTSGTRGIANELDGLNGQTEPMRSDLEGIFEETTSREANSAALPYAEGDPELRENVSAYSHVVFSSEASNRGSIINVSYNDGESIEGTVVFQHPDVSYNYTNNSGHPNWNIVEGADSIPRAWFNVSDVDPGDSGEVYVIDPAGSQGVRLEISDSTVELVPVQPGRSTRTLCSSTPSGVLGPDDEVHVEMRKPQNRVTTVYAVGPSGRDRCGSFELNEYIDPPYTVGIEDGDQLNGTYAVAVPGLPSTGHDPTDPALWPKEETGVVNPVFDVSYVSDGITYDSQFALYNRTEP